MMALKQRIENRKKTMFMKFKLKKHLFIKKKSEEKEESEEESEESD